MTSEEWKAWQAENMRLTLDGWTLYSDYYEGWIDHYAIKGDKRIDRNPKP